jgi:hypothetical protein
MEIFDGETLVKRLSRGPHTSFFQRGLKIAFAHLLSSFGQQPTLQFRLKRTSNAVPSDNDHLNATKCLILDYEVVRGW